SDRMPRLSFRDWKYLDAHLIWIYEGDPQMGSKSRVSNDFYTVWYLDEGGVTVTVAGESVSAGRGDWLFLAPGVSEREFKPGSRILSIYFEARWITGQLLFDFSTPILLGPERTQEWSPWTRSMIETVQRDHPQAYNHLPREKTDFESYARLQGDFQRWFGRLWGIARQCGVSEFLPQQNDPRALAIKMRLDAQGLQIPFRLTSLAGELHLSPAQVNRIFAGTFGTTPKRYFERRRLAVVEAALCSTTQPIKEIAFGAGFRHQSEFSAWFRKHTGAAPSEYRLRPPGHRKESLADARPCEGARPVRSLVSGASLEG
ncbi:MAG: helix-turn-helix transcriptional regulator, partial [Puniceicoccales bacterium]